MKPKDVIQTEEQRILEDRTSLQRRVQEAIDLSMQQLYEGMALLHKATPEEENKFREQTLRAEAYGAALNREYSALCGKAMANPNIAGWDRLCVLLDNALQDELIASSPGASAFLQLAFRVATVSFANTNIDQTLEPLKEIMTEPYTKILRTNEGRHKGGDAMAKRAKDHRATLTQEVIKILKNPKTADWTNPEIAKFLISRGLHNSDGTQRKLRTMTERVREIRAEYKASISTR